MNTPMHGIHRERDCHAMEILADYDECRAAREAAGSLVLAVQQTDLNETLM
jgi:hypothetical protein